MILDRPKYTQTRFLFPLMSRTTTKGYHRLVPEAVVLHTDNMKFLQVPKLAELTSFLSTLEIGDQILTGIVENEK